MRTACRGIAGVNRTEVSIIAVEGIEALALALLADILNCTGIAIIAVAPIRHRSEQAFACGRLTEVLHTLLGCRRTVYDGLGVKHALGEFLSQNFGALDHPIAQITVVAIVQAALFIVGNETGERRPSLADPVLTGRVHLAFAAITPLIVHRAGTVNTTPGLVAGIDRAVIAVVTFVRLSLTLSLTAAVLNRTDVSVIAGKGVWLVDTPDLRLTDIIRAWVVIDTDGVLRTVDILVQFFIAIVIGTVDPIVRRGHLPRVAGSVHSTELQSVAEEPVVAIDRLEDAVAIKAAVNRAKITVIAKRASIIHRRLVDLTITVIVKTIALLRYRGCSIAVAQPVLATDPGPEAGSELVAV